MHCQGCCASTWRRMHSLQTLPASARFHRPAVNADIGFASLHSLHSLSSRYFARSALQSNLSPPQNRNSNSRPTFAPLWNGAAGKGLYTNNPCLSWTRVNAMYAVNGSPASPMCMSMMTPSLQVCPWAAWAVVGSSGSCSKSKKHPKEFATPGQTYSYCTEVLSSMLVPSHIVVFAKPPSCRVSIWPQGATSRCLRSKRPYVCLAVRLPLSLYSTPLQLGGSAAPGR